MAKLEILQADYKTLSRTVIPSTETQGRFVLNALTFYLKRKCVLNETLRRSVANVKAFFMSDFQACFYA